MCTALSCNMLRQYGDIVLSTTHNYLSKISACAVEVVVGVVLGLGHRPVIDNRLRPNTYRPRRIRTTNLLAQPNTATLVPGHYVCTSTNIRAFGRTVDDTPKLNGRCAQPSARRTPPLDPPMVPGHSLRTHERRYEAPASASRDPMGSRHQAALAPGRRDGRPLPCCRPLPNAALGRPPCSTVLFLSFRPHEPCAC